MSGKLLIFSQTQDLLANQRYRSFGLGLDNNFGLPDMLTHYFLVDKNKSMCVLSLIPSVNP